MDTPLTKSSRFEQQMTRQLREACEAEIARRELSKEELAALLGLVHLGVEICFARSWSLEKAIRIASLLGLAVTMTVESDGIRYERSLDIGSLSRPSGLAERLAV